MVAEEISQIAEPATTFETPLPVALKDFQIDDVEPQVYRPFRHGPNHITMGIRKMDWNNWIEIDSNYMKYHDRKVKQLSNNLKDHVQYVDNEVTRDAAYELFEELTRYLTHRYPNIFRLDGPCLLNLATGEKFAYPAREYTQVLSRAQNSG